MEQSTVIMMNANNDNRPLDKIMKAIGKEYHWWSPE